LDVTIALCPADKDDQRRVILSFRGAVDVSGTGFGETERELRVSFRTADANLAPPDAMEPAFGPGSRERHAGLAQQTKDPRAEGCREVLERHPKAVDVASGKLDQRFRVAPRRRAGERCH